MKATPRSAERRVQIARVDSGRRGAQVDDDLPGAAVVEHPAVAEHDRFDDRAVGQRQEHDLAAAATSRRGSPATPRRGRRAPASRS